MQRRPLPAKAVQTSGQSWFEIPDAFTPIMWKTMPGTNIPVRYKCYYGGRGGAKSYNFARALVAEAYTEHHLILCTREFQNTIADSVKRVIERQIIALGLAQWFNVGETFVKARLTNSEFIFKGLRRDIQGIRSLEGVTRCWVEEAQWATRDSLLILDPTVREPGSQLWFSYNPVNDTDAVHQMFVTGGTVPNDAIVRKVSWRDNPWFPEELDRLRRRTLEVDPDSYDWVWEGNTRHISSASVFRHQYAIESFDEPEKVDRYFYGVDWGFSNDPLAAVRCYIHDDDLYVTHEFYEVGVELDDIGVALGGGRSERDGREYEGIPGIKDWPVKADSSRPETISYVRRQGLAVAPAEKWSGSVEDGVSHLKAFGKIHIHPRCVNTAQEFRMYSYKTDPHVIDPRTNEPEVLPKIIDKWNHTIDSLRYALDGHIHKAGGLGSWARFGKNVDRVMSQ